MNGRVAVGRARLSEAHDITDLVSSQDRFRLYDGLHALQEASDLVGPACQAPLYSGTFS